MKVAVQQRLAEDAAAAAQRRAAAAALMVEVNAANDAMLGRKKAAAVREAEADAAIAAYVREREVREQVRHVLVSVRAHFLSSCAASATYLQCPTCIRYCCTAAAFFSDWTLTWWQCHLSCRRQQRRRRLLRRQGRWRRCGCGRSRSALPTPRPRSTSYAPAGACIYTMCRAFHCVDIWHRLSTYRSCTF